MSPLPAVLRVEEVMLRYGMRDRRTARSLMYDAGGFKVAGRLVVREDDLGAHERRLAAPANPPRLVSAAVPSRSRRAPQASPGASPADGPDWWRREAS